MDRKMLIQRIRENTGETPANDWPPGVTVNPHERKIDAILSEKRNRQPMYATLPKRNGKRFRALTDRGQEFSALVFTGESDPL